MKTRLIEEMRPGQIDRIVQGSGMVFIPVSPRFEWHGRHLPVGTAGIIAEEVAFRMAEEFDGAAFRTLSLGLDEFRNEDQKKQWGLDGEAEVFGMNFPTLDFTSEYSEPRDMERIVSARLAAVRGCGFRYAFLINHHGGHGQVPTLQKIAETFTSDDFHVEALRVMRFSSFHPPGEAPESLYLKVGGHAGIAETHQLMAFRPDLADLAELPDGELSVRESGILHNQPKIQPEFNPRNASQELADALRASILENMTLHIRQIVANGKNGK